MALRTTEVKKQPVPPKPGAPVGLGLGGPATSFGNPTRPKINPTAPAPVKQPMAFGLGPTPGAPKPPTAPTSAPAQAAKTQMAGTQPDPTDPTSPYYTGNNEDAAAIAAEIAKTDSALMENAAYQGTQTAADRGMLNSSMAAEAAQTAVLDVAVPLAQQEAQQNFQKNMSGLGLQQQTEMAKFDRQTQMMTQAFEQRNNMQLAKFDSKTQMALLEAEQLGEMAMMESEQGFVAQQAELDRALQQELAKLELTADEQQGAEAALLNAFNDYEAQIASINANPNLSAEERASQIQAAQTMLEMRIEYTNDLYSTAFDWPDNPWKA